MVINLRFIQSPGLLKLLHVPVKAFVYMEAALGTYKNDPGSLP